MNLKINTRSSANFKNAIINVDFFSEFEFNLKYDSIASTFAIKFYFDPRNKDHAELACVSHFHECILQHNGETLLTGYIVSNVFNDSSEKELTSIGGYSKTGTLEDCDVPPSISLEYNGLTLLEVIKTVISPLKIGLVIDNSVYQSSITSLVESGDPTIDNNGNISNEGNQISIGSQQKSTSEKFDKKIKKTKTRETMSIKQFLTELATQRNIVLSHDEKGNLLLTEAHTNKAPLMYFDVVNNGLIGTHMSMSFNGQAMHSHIYCLKQADSDGGNVDSNEFIIRNPYVPILYRPKVVVQSSGDSITMQEFAQQQLAAELKNITLTITTDRWDIDGVIIRPNNMISVRNPSCYIYEKTNFFIESVSYKGDSKETIATLTCVLPEVYNKKSPKNIYVDPDENLPNF